jgi:hypothetical protein
VALSASDDKSKKPKLWIFIGYGAVGVVILGVLLYQYIDTMTWHNRFLNRQLAEVKEGKQTGIIDPDPGFLEKTLEDKETAATITQFTINGYETSDPRFSCLKRFPNVKVVRLEYAGNTNAF